VKILFIHQDLPGQFKHLMAYLARRPDTEVMGLGERLAVRRNCPAEIPGLRLMGYDLEPMPTDLEAMSGDLRVISRCLRRGKAVALSLQRIKHQGFVPDIVYGHPGWGETLHVKDVFPDTVLINYCEFFFHRTGQDFGFDKEFADYAVEGLHVKVQNMIQLSSLATGPAGISPTYWQHSGYPAAQRREITVIHDGVDTRRLKPDPDACFVIPGTSISLKRSDEVITYVARNLEPYRGFHIFMRALPALLKRRPEARIVIAGGNGVSYGRPLVTGTYWQRAIDEVGAGLDMSRVHKVGPLPYAEYLKLLQVSTAHVYLTYPFVLSWSMLEAMALGCAVVGSNTAPVTEVIRHGENGFLVDFFSPKHIVEQVVEICDDRKMADRVGHAARQTVISRYDLHSICLPRQIEVLREAMLNSPNSGLGSI
jgi:glycosyltransferase involved in cell wall biosynthesis